MTIRPGVVAPYDTSSYSVSQGTGAGASNYIPELFSSKMLRDFYSRTVFSEISNTDYEGEIKGQGDKVHIRRVPTLSIGDYVVGGPSGGINYEVPAEDHEELVIDQAKYWAFRMDYIDRAQTDLNLVDEFAASASEQLKIEVDKEILTYITSTGQANAANVGHTAGAVSASIDLGADVLGEGRVVNATDGDPNNILRVILEMNQVLDENNVPEEGRWVVLPAAITTLLKAGDLRRADVTGDSTGVIRTGKIGMVDNMTIYKSNNLARGANETSAFLIPFGTKDALTFAGQITVTEELPITESFGKYWRGLFVYGRSVIQDKALGVAVLKLA